MTPDDLMNRIEASGDCWVWTGSKTSAGYGQAYVGPGGERGAHRVFYELFVGPIPRGMQICHRCDNPPCVNPDHLFVGTQKDNMLDRVRKRRGRGQTSPTCRNGHEWSETNTYWLPGTMKRTCRACNREAARRISSREVGE